MPIFYRICSSNGSSACTRRITLPAIIYDSYSEDTPHTPGIQCGNGYIKNLTVNKYVISFNRVTKEEDSVTNDADGKPTEN